ncbi:iduronate 2-sulfatase [Melitaea cinxia]|uniref:iduronate 2-sulfatase n=1 Tax=Melitaea cinxia TaxID=113334 RepID=UPI001E270DDE|nr:iduronate 2-sulfatase [Melitaea cinxia]
MRHLTGKNVFLPNIQKIARKSIAFENAFAQQALCAPSRNSILTGRRPDKLHLYDFYSYWRDVVGNFSTFPQIFKENGYDTYSVGKIFHPGLSSNFTDDYPYSWTEKPYHPASQKYKDAAVCKSKHSNELHKNLLCPINVREQPDGTLPDLETLKYSIDLLKKRNDKPFLLAVGFHKPHIPLKYPHKYLRKVPIGNVQPPSMPYMPNEMPTVAWHPWTDVRQRDDIKNLNISFPFGTIPPKWTLKIRQNYYAAALYIDDLVGNLIRHVDINNTIVVLTSDHGWSLGENGLWAKYSNFDVALRVPLIFKIPNKPPKSILTPVELIDIFPTILTLADIQPPINCKNYDKSVKCIDGKSLIPLMSSKSDFSNSIKFAISQYPRPSEYPMKNSDKPRLKDIKIMGYSIRTKRYRYTEWVEFNNTMFSRDWNKLYGIELYDHDLDEEESINVYDKHKYKNVKIQLSHLLRSHVD